MMEVPKRTTDTIDAYVKLMWRPGGFVQAVLSNNLCEAFGRADDTNRACMEQIVRYVYNNVPRCAWGSPEAVDAWLTKPQAKD